MTGLAFIAAVALMAHAPVGHLKHTRLGVNCTRCHLPFEVGQDRKALHLPGSDRCSNATCHSNGAEAKCGAGATDCVACHIEEDEIGSLTNLRNALNFDHAVHLTRTKGDCVRCHRGAATSDASGRGSLPAMEDCRSCHAQWLDDLKCAPCHVSLAQYPVMPITQVTHGPGFFSTHGKKAITKGDLCAQCHGQTFCRDCHDRRSPLPPDYVFMDRPERAPVHRMDWRETHATDARLSPERCLGCHTPVDCNGCHERAGFKSAGDGLGRAPHPPGYASANHGRDARRDILACASCHSGSGGDICVTCHAVGRKGGSPHAGRNPGGDVHKRPCRECHSGSR